MKKRFSEEQVIGFLREAEAAGDRECAADEALGRDAPGSGGEPRSATAKVVTVPPKRELVRFAQGRGMSERRALKLVGMSPSVLLRFKVSGKPNQNAYVESFNGRLRDECLNQNWFTSLAHARMAIEEWRRDYNEDRPKKDLGGVPPTVYAARLNSPANPGATESSTVCNDGL